MKNQTSCDTAVQFGSVLWITAFCPICKVQARVRPYWAERTPENPNGEVYGCCERNYIRAGVKIKENRVVKGSSKHRRKPSHYAQKRILEQQSDRCLYCVRRFGSSVFFKNHGAMTRVRLKLVWDHFIPYVYSLDSCDANFVAACHICNQFKSDKMLATVTEYQTYISQCTARLVFDSECEAA